MRAARSSRTRLAYGAPLAPVMPTTIFRGREALGADAPPAAFFVYEGWHHLYASDPDGRYGSPARWDFRARVRRDRAAWRAIARAMSGPHVVGPGVGARIRDAEFSRSNFSHAVLARDEFKTADIPLPIDVDAFLARIDAVSAGN